MWPPVSVCAHVCAAGLQVSLCAYVKNDACGHGCFYMYVCAHTSACACMCFFVHIQVHEVLYVCILK